MPRFEQDNDVRALGEALAALRRDRGLSQAEAGARVAMTSQGWGLYESGRRPGLFRPDVQRRLTAALEASPEDLALAVVRGRTEVEPMSPAIGVESGVRSWVPAPRISGPQIAGSGRAPAGAERLQLSNDDLAPWAVSGVMLEFDAGRWPRRDQGCVIDMKDGGRLVRIYDRADSDRLYVRGGPQGLDVETVLGRADVIRVAAVIGRLE